jgi:hypothetical protein
LDRETDENAAGSANGAAPPPWAPGGEKFEEQIKLPLPQDFSLPEDCHKLMKALVDTIYVHGDERCAGRRVFAAAPRLRLCCGGLSCPKERGRPLGLAIARLCATSPMQPAAVGGK